MMLSLLLWLVVVEVAVVLDVDVEQVLDAVDQALLDVVEIAC